MVFRLPTPFDSVPSARLRSPHSRPWRGTFILHNIDTSNASSESSRLHICSAETEGDKSSRTDLWPKQFELQITQPTCSISDLQVWIRAHDVPLCMFMPDRHLVGRTNEAQFRSFAQLLIEHQMVCIAPWSNVDVLVGAGILILPNPSSTGLLIGAVFLQGAFPDILFSSSPRNIDAIPSGLTMAQPYSSSTIASGSQQLQQPFMRHNSPGNSSPQNGPGQFLVSQQSMRGSALYLRNSMKAQGEELTSSPTAILRQTLAGPAFESFIFDDTTDGSGCTSPGSTRHW